MTDSTDKSIPKLGDFGLAKIVASKQKVTEQFGTMNYVSPEILLKKPYSYPTDIWSFGIIIYALCSGIFPFDHENESIAAKLICKYKLEFDSEFDHCTKDCLDLIT